MLTKLDCQLHDESDESGHVSYPWIKYPDTFLSQLNSLKYNQAVIWCHYMHLKTMG